MKIQTLFFFLVFLFPSLAFSQTAQQLYQAGDDAYMDDDCDEAIYFLKKAAEKGHAQAAVDLAELYEDGDCVDENMLRAFFYYKKAAGLGSADGKYGLAACYLDGTGTTQNRTKGIALLKEVARMRNQGIVIDMARDDLKEMGLTW